MLSVANDDAKSGPAPKHLAVAEPLITEMAEFGQDENRDAIGIERLRN